MIQGKGDNNKYKYKTYRAPLELKGKQLENHLDYKTYKFEQEVSSNNYISASGATFKDFTKIWQTNWLEKEVSQNTIMLRLSSLENHIMPILGHLTVDKITTMMLLDLMNNLTRKDGQKGDLSISAKQEVHKVLISIFKRAIDWQVIINNPMDGVKAPTDKRRHDKKLNVYNAAEVRTLLGALQNELEHWRIFMSLALATGMCRGELLALEWRHVNLDNGTINIKQIISKTRDGIETKEPKYNSIRMIALPTTLISELKRYKLHSRKERRKLQLKRNESKHDWLFYNENGNHFHPDTPTKW